MCSYIVEKAALTGSAKGRGWMKIDTAHVYYDHPFHAPLDHALGIDFINAANGGRERVAIEISAEVGARAGARDPRGAGKRRAGARRRRSRRKPPARPRHRPADRQRSAITRRRRSTAAAAQVAQQGADDVGIVVGPDPLARIALADRPELRLGQHAEIRLVARDRRDASGSNGARRRPLDVAAVIDAHDRAVAPRRCRPPPTQARDCGSTRASPRCRSA